METTFPSGHPDGIVRSERHDYHEAHVTIGPDETAHIQLPDDALALLRDHVNAATYRRNVTAVGRRLTPKHGEPQRHELIRVTENANF